MHPISNPVKTENVFLLNFPLIQKKSRNYLFSTEEKEFYTALKISELLAKRRQEGIPLFIVQFSCCGLIADAAIHYRSIKGSPWASFKNDSFSGHHKRFLSGHNEQSFGFALFKSCLDTGEFKFIPDKKSFSKDKTVYFNYIFACATPIDKTEENKIFEFENSSYIKSRGEHRFLLALYFEKKAELASDLSKKATLISKYKHWLNLAIIDRNIDARIKQLKDLFDEVKNDKHKNFLKPEIVEKMIKIRKIHKESINLEAFRDISTKICKELIGQVKNLDRGDSLKGLSEAEAIEISWKSAKIVEAWKEKYGGGGETSPTVLLKTKRNFNTETQLRKSRQPASKKSACYSQEQQFDKWVTQNLEENPIAIIRSSIQEIKALKEKYRMNLSRFIVLSKTKEVFDAPIYFRARREKDIDIFELYKSTKKSCQFKLIVRDLKGLKHNFEFYLKYISACDLLSTDRQSRGINRYSLALIYEDKAKKAICEVKRDSWMKKYKKWLDLAIEDENRDACKRKIQDLHQADLSKMTLSENLKASKLVLQLISSTKKDLSLEQTIIYRTLLYNTLKLLYNKSIVDLANLLESGHAESDSKIGF